MKYLFIFILCVLAMRNIVAQEWIPKGYGFLPQGYAINSISAVDDTVIWVNASVESVVNSGTPVPADHLIKIIRSTNGGETWESHGVEESIGRISFDIQAVDAYTAWITSQDYGSGLDRALYKTEDGGITWTNKLLFRGAGVFLRILDGQHLFCQNNKYIAWSADGGENWTRDTIEEYSSNEYNILFSGTNMACMIGDTIWVGTSLGRIVRFTQYGANYEMISTGLPYSITNVSFADHLNGMIYYSSIRSLARTHDGGNTWEVTPSLPEATLNYNITHVTGTNETYVTTTSSGSHGAQYFWTTDFGNTWTSGDEIENAETNCIQFLSPTIGWIARRSITGDNDPIIYKWTGDLQTSVKNAFNQLTGFRMSPNPALDMIKYDFDDHSGGSHFETITDVKGQVVSARETTEKEVDISHLIPGVYFIHIKVNELSGIWKFVKLSN